MGGFIQVWRPALLLLGFWCWVRPARCCSSIREPSVPALEMNSGPVNGAWLVGPCGFSPLIRRSTIYGKSGRLPAAEERGWLKDYNTLNSLFDHRRTKNTVTCICMCPSVYTPILAHFVCTNPCLCVWTKAGSRSAEAELAKMGRLASHQRRGLWSHWGGRVWVYFPWRCDCSKVSLSFILDSET